MDRKALDDAGIGTPRPQGSPACIAVSRSNYWTQGKKKLVLKAVNVEVMGWFPTRNVSLGVTALHEPPLNLDAQWVQTS